MENSTGKPSRLCNFAGCELPHYCHGYCIGHYQQNKRGSELKPLYRREQTLTGRFWSKVDKSGECWLWTGSKTTGYGRISVQGVLQLAHRVSFEWENGPIPDGFLVDHICHQTLCVRPEHLRLATTKQNQEHRLGAARHSSTGVRGVFRSGNRFVGRVKHSGKQHDLGYFTTAEAAESAVVAKRLELFTHNDMDRI